MLERSLHPRVETALEEFPVVGLFGPRQVGKTTLAQEIAERRGAAHVRYLDLETTADRARLTDAADYFDAQEGRLVILDEISRRRHAVKTFLLRLARRMNKPSLRRVRGHSLEVMTGLASGLRVG